MQAHYSLSRSDQPIQKKQSNWLNCCGAYGEIKENVEQVNCGGTAAAVHCTQIKPTIWSEPFDHALREAGDDNDDDIDHDE